MPVDVSGSPPPLLYHYTGQDGLTGILSSEAVWASQVQYLNDGQELTLCLDLTGRWLRSQPDFQGDGRRSRLLRAMEGWLERVGLVDVYVASFTEEGDLLSQWRGYCRPGDAFSIGIPSTHLVAAAYPFWRLLRCVYEQAEQFALIAAHVEEHVERLEQARRDFPDEDESKRLDSVAFIFLIELLQLAPAIKHWEFREEREWRLVSPRLIEYPSTRVMFRRGRHTLIPYYEYPLTGLHDVDLEVIVGPTQHPDLSINAVLSLLKHKGYRSGARRSSKVPFRDW